MARRRDLLEQLTAAEPRLDPGHLPVNVHEVRWVADPKGSGQQAAAWDFDLHHRTLDVAGTARLVGGALVLTHLTLDVAPTVEDAHPAGDWLRTPAPADCITPDNLRRLPLGSIVESVRREILAREVFDRLAPDFGRSVSDEARRVHQRAANAVKGKTLRRGRPSLGADHFRHVAEVALGLQQRGVPSVRRALAEYFSVSEETSRDWVRRARREGAWLAPTQPGIKGVFPGRRLLEAWDQEKEQR